MRWYDYVACVIIADFITAFAMAGSIFVVLPVFWYVVYVDFRLWMKENR